MKFQYSTLQSIPFFNNFKISDCNYFSRFISFDNHYNCIVLSSSSIPRFSSKVKYRCPLFHCSNCIVWDSIGERPAFILLGLQPFAKLTFLNFFLIYYSDLQLPRFSLGVYPYLSIYIFVQITWLYTTRHCPRRYLL